MALPRPFALIRAIRVKTFTRAGGVQSEATYFPVETSFIGPDLENCPGRTREMTFTKTFCATDFTSERPICVIREICGQTPGLLVAGDYLGVP